MTPTIIRDHMPQISEVIQQNDISYLGIYGSFSRGEQTPTSDLDLLVSFKENKGLIGMVGVQEKLSSILGVEVDLITKEGMSKYIKPYIQDDLETIYLETN